MIPNLGQVLGIVARHEASEVFMHIDVDMHKDVDAWGAPSEAHDELSRGEARRWREVRKHAEAVAQRPWRIIVREAQRRGVVVSNVHPQWQTIVARVYNNENFPFSANGTLKWARGNHAGLFLLPVRRAALGGF